MVSIPDTLHAWRMCSSFTFPSKCWPYLITARCFETTQRISDKCTATDMVYPILQTSKYCIVQCACCCSDNIRNMSVGYLGMAMDYWILWVSPCYKGKKCTNSSPWRSTVVATVYIGYLYTCWPNPKALLVCHLNTDLLFESSCSSERPTLLDAMCTRKRIYAPKMTTF